MEGDENLFENDTILNQIGTISTKVLFNITHKFQSLKESLGFKKTNSAQIKDTQTQDFDSIMQKITLNLQNVRLRLQQLENPNLLQKNEKNKQFVDDFCRQICRYKKTLMVRQSQLDCINYILMERQNPRFLQKYEERYGLLGKFIIQPCQLKKQINIGIIEQQIETQCEFLDDYECVINEIGQNIVNKKYLNNLEELKKLANRMKIINSKIVTIAEVFPYACTLSTSDLFTYKKDHKRWVQLFQNYVTYRKYQSSQTVRKSFQATKNNLNFINASMNILHNTKSLSITDSKNWEQILNSTNKLLKCAIFKGDAHHQAQVLISNPNSELAKQIWNLPQQQSLRKIIGVSLPYIEYSQQIFIERIFHSYLKEENKNLPDLLVKDPQKYAQELFIKRKHEERLQLRINSPFPIKNMFETGANKLVQSMTSFFKKKETPQTIIYHIHGGGFISMSSFVHQTYTRLWANDLKVPIISVDYGKAPQYPFPHGLHDCFEGYMWMLYVFHQIFDAHPKKVILVGDSAGGNLVAALTNLLILKNLRIPDGIVLVYPALNLNYESYTPSLLTSLNDMILPHTFLKICLEAYLQGDVDPDNDPLVSPVKANKEILEKYPATRIFVGSKDPFHDDCCRLCEKLNMIKSGLGMLTIFDEFPHGFLQFDLKTQPHYECRKAILQVEDALKQLIK